MNRIMLDLETMGIGSNSAIMAIGAVRFSSGDIINEFYKTIDLKSCVQAGLEIEPETVIWWMNQSDDARKQFFQTNNLSLIDVLNAFSEWILDDAEVWGNGAAFDNVILANAYKKCGMIVPWQFYNDRCYRTIKSLNPEITLKRIGIHHCAIDDAKSQAHHLMNMLKI